MFQDAFTKFDEKESKTVLAEINPALTGEGFDSASVTVLGQAIAFYPGYRFLDIADYEMTPHMRKFVVYKPGDVTVLDWTNRPVYALNDKVPLALNDETVADYMRFFFDYVRGPHGKFSVVENVDDIPWRDEPPPAARKALGKLLFPVSPQGRNEDGSYRLGACMVFGDILYKTAVFITANGRVTIADQEIMVDDMPVLDDVFGQ